jgi:hypothetical protein
MPKRILAALVGLIAVVAGCVTLIYAFSAADGYSTPGPTAKADPIAAFLMLSMAVAIFVIAVRFLRFAWKSSITARNGWVRPVLLGIGFFFPGFVFSLPLTLAWETFRRPCAGPGDDVALKVSMYVGIASASICFAVLMRKRALKSKLR